MWLLLLPSIFCYLTFSLLILYMNCFSTLKRLQDYKQKSKIATPTPTPLYLPLKVGSPRIDGTLKDSLTKCYQLFPQIGRETKIKINGKLCHILVLSSANLFTLESADGIQRKLAKASKGWEFLPVSTVLDLCSV